MRNKPGRKLKLVLLVATLVSTVLALTIPLWTRAYRAWVLPADDVKDLLNAVVAKHKHQVDEQRETWLAKNKKLTWADNGRQWQKIEQEMSLSGASANEVAHVFRVVRNTGIDGHHDASVFIWPTYAERGQINNQPVWVIESAWEYCRRTNKGLDVAPIHFWRVAIWGKWPYSVLDSERCS